MEKKPELCNSFNNYSSKNITEKFHLRVKGKEECDLSLFQEERVKPKCPSHSICGLLECNSLCILMLQVSLNI